MESTVGKYPTEIAVISCPECGAKNEIIDRIFPEWSCRECEYEPDWSDHGNGEDEIFRCTWCAKSIEDNTGVVHMCRSCTRQSQQRAKLERSQCCPHCQERLTADDLRKIKEARREARAKISDVRKNSGDNQ